MCGSRGRCTTKEAVGGPEEGQNQTSYAACLGESLSPVQSARSGTQGDL
jgi:hypothetical protein